MLPALLAPTPRRLGLALGLCSLLVAAGCEAPSILKETPDKIAFAPIKERIPGTLVQSDVAKVTGFRGRRPTLAYAEGSAEQLVLNGKPVGNRAWVRNGDRIALLVRAPKAYGEDAVGTVRIGNGGGEFKVSSVRRTPPAKLAFGEVEVAPGRGAYSTFVAPTGFAPGSKLMVEATGQQKVQVETKDGRVDPPVAIDPGEPFRLITRVPPDWSGPLKVGVKLGELEGSWDIRVP